MEKFNEIVATLADDYFWGSINSIFKTNIPFLGEMPILAVLLLGTGFYLTIILRFMPILRIPAGFALLWKGRKAGKGEEGQITPFAALMTALSSTVGTGNLAGVATAITLGGPGAIFWMWMTALVGMATKYAESMLAVRYREVDADGNYKGGPMYYIKNGLGPKWKWLAIIFSVGTLAGAVAAGDMVQSNGIADVVNESFGTPRVATGLILAGLAFVVIIGGIKSIGKFASKLVPIMAFSYVTAAIIVLIMNASGIPGAFKLIFDGAFSGNAATGGFSGAVVALAIRAGIARGLFSNEAGQGSAPIAHAAAKTKDPVQQGTIAMLGTFIDTIVICTMTALVILTVSGDFKHNPAVSQLKACAINSAALGSEQKIRVDSGLFTVANGDHMVEVDGKIINKTDFSKADVVAKLDQCKALAATGNTGIVIDDNAYAGVMEDLRLPVDNAWQSDLEGARITSAAFAAGIPGGGYIITFALMVFAFTTILGWSYYGERAISFLFGEKAVLPFRVIWCVFTFLGALLAVKSVWKLGDIGNAAMAAPNLIAVLLLSGVVVSMTRGGKDTRPIQPHDESAHAKGLHNVDGKPD